MYARVRSLSQAALLALALTVSALLVLIGQLAQLGVAPQASAADTLPYKDPNAIGQLTLCDASNQAMTKGEVKSAPFAFRAVGSSPAPESVSGAGRTASLFGFQPRQNVSPDQWNGEFLTASSRYTNAQAPMAAGTDKDPSLAEFLVAYPPMWDGLIQLRMFLSAPLQAGLTDQYNAAAIKISGNSWTLVQGGASSSACTSGSSTSVEQVLLTSSAPPTAQTGKSAAAATSAASTTGPAGASASPSASANRSIAASNAAADAHSAKKSGGPDAAGWFFGLAGVIVVTLCGLLFWRRRLAGRLSTR